jgi:hypothetical protein
MTEEHVRTTTALLRCGVVAGPLYLVVGLAQAFTREGFDLTRHSLSLLQNGSLGWIQIGNLLLTGLLTIACAVGVRRVLHPGRGGTWGPVLVGVYGTGVLLAGVFRADPADGFPPGTPPGQGEVSWHGIAHLACFGVGFLCLIAACFVVARGLAARGRRPWAIYSWISAAILLLGLAAMSTAMTVAVLLVAVWTMVVVGWAWLAAISAHLANQAATDQAATVR